VSPDYGVGVVLSGGGANGAYEVGVLKALFHGASPASGYRPLDPGIYTGTSVGAYNSAVLSSRPGTPGSRVIEELEAIWLDRLANTLWNCGNGVFRVRGAPFQFLDPGCLVRPLQSLAAFGRDAAELAGFGALKGAQFVTSGAPLQSRLLSLIDLEAFVSETPLAEVLHDTVDLDSLRRSEQRLVIAASNWERGILRLFSKQEIADRVGIPAILASAALPGIFPPVAIDGERYVDGGVLLNTPLKPAIAAGATTLHVIFLDPLIQDIASRPLPSTLDTFYRLFAILWAANMRQDILLSADITRTLELLEREEPESASRPEARRLLRMGRRLERRSREGAGYRKMTVHVYRPATDLGGGVGLLDFHRERLAALVEMGYRDAACHDCEAAGCVVLGKAPPRAPALVEQLEGAG